jgi:hypothetical protein
VEKCGAPTKAGTPCRWGRDECRIAAHRDWHLRGSRTRSGKGPSGATAPARARPIPAAIGRGDIAGVAWWALEGVAGGSLESGTAMVMASLLRVLLAAGDTAPPDDDALLEVELRGLLMHGLPPRNGEEWAVAEARFSAEAMDEVRRWQRLLEGDALDGIEPGIRGEE